MRNDPYTNYFNRLWWLIIAVGVGSSLIGLAFLYALGLMQRFLWPSGSFTLTQAAILLGAGCAVSLLARWLGDPGGVDLLVDNIHVLGGPRDVRELRSLIPISLICIAAGGAAGPEAPLVQGTGALGAWLAQCRRLSRDDKRILTITGMAAGFTALFGVPLGAAIFALEILHRRGLEYYEALIPAIVGSLCGYAVFAAGVGLNLRPVWEFPAVGALRPADMAWALAAGVLAAAVAHAFVLINNFLRPLFQRTPGALRPIIGAGCLGLLACVSPYALTFGEAQIGELLAAHPSAFLLAAALGAKLIATSCTISSGWRGGFIIPLFFVGVCLGQLGHLAFPSSNEMVLMAAMMAAINTGVTKTPIGSMLVVTGMAGLRLIPTTLIATIVCMLLTQRIAIFHNQRPRDPDMGQEPTPV